MKTDRQLTVPSTLRASPPRKRTELNTIVSIGNLLLLSIDCFLRALMYIKLGKIKAILVPRVDPARDPTAPIRRGDS